MKRDMTHPLCPTGKVLFFALGFLLLFQTVAPHAADAPDPDAPAPDNAPSAHDHAVPTQQNSWNRLEPGLDFREFQLDENGVRLAVVRIDPARFDFVLCSSSQDAQPARPLAIWGEQYNLVVAINASMYLPDGSTSTGYMRQGTHINNHRIAQRFGAFFVAGPDTPDLPHAAIIDRDNPDWQNLIDRYTLVIQNYRMTNAERRVLWSTNGPLYSISAVAQDGDGRILFLHCREPVEAYALAQRILLLPLNARTVMYVEGGAQAGLLIRSASLTRVMAGRWPADFLVTGNLKAALPNVLGAHRKP